MVVHSTLCIFLQEELDHARKEIEKRAGALDDEAGADDSDPEKASRPSNLQLEINLTLEIGQVSSNWQYEIHKSFPNKKKISHFSFCYRSCMPGAWTLTSTKWPLPSLGCWGPGSLCRTGSCPREGSCLSCFQPGIQRPRKSFLAARTSRRLTAWTAKHFTSQVRFTPKVLVVSQAFFTVFLFCQQMDFHDSWV